MTTFTLFTHTIAALAIVAGALGLWFDRFVANAYRVLVAGFGILTVSLVARWMVTGHPALFGTFENAAAATWFIVGVVLIDRYRLSNRVLPGRLAPALAAWTILILGFGAFFNPDPYPLTISERSIFIDIHVLIAWLAHTVLLIGGTAALLQVTHMVGDIDEDDMHQIVFRGAGVGLALFSAMIAVGSFYDFLLFSNWFTWEVVEVFAVAAWIAYALVIHAVMFFGWRGQRLAWAMLAATVLMLGTFWVWSFYSDTYHHFEIPALRAGSVTTR